MPELPEAETIVRSLRPRLERRRIVAAAFHAARVSADNAADLAGRCIAGVRRHGKQVLIELDRGCIHVKLGMTGALLVDSPPTPYTRATLELDDGTVLRFDDVRQFGSLRLLAAPPAGLGPDPLEMSEAEFVARLRRRNKAVKPLLLDQAFVRGIGNIYADETLFGAGIHPLARAPRLSRARAASLHRAVATVLESAIQHRGSSISDYVDATGEKGGFQLLHCVYGKEGEPCPRCGGPIRRIVVAQRGTHFCPRCQRR